MDAQKKARYGEQWWGQLLSGRGKSVPKKEWGGMNESLFLPHFLSPASPPFNVASLASCFLVLIFVCLLFTLVVSQLNCKLSFFGTQQNISYRRGRGLGQLAPSAPLSSPSQIPSSLARKSILKLCFWDSLRSFLLYRAHKSSKKVEQNWDLILEMATEFYVVSDIIWHI